MKSLKRRKVSKKDDAKVSSIYSTRSSIDMDCETCGALVENLPADTKSVLCSRCVSRMVAPPPQPKSVSQNGNGEKNPRGWHLKRLYISPSGKKYSFGKEVIDDDEGYAVPIEDSDIGVAEVDIESSTTEEKKKKPKKSKTARSHRTSSKRKSK